MATSAVILAFGATVTRADIPALVSGLDTRLRGAPGGPVICDVAAVRRPDVVTVEALARLRQVAGRNGRRLVLRGPGPALLALIALLGLAEVLPEAGRQAEEREQPGGVQVVVEPGDPVA